MTERERADLSAAKGALLRYREVLLPLGFALVMGAGLGYFADRVSREPWHSALAALAVLLVGYGGFILASLLGLAVVSHRLDGLDQPRRERFRDHWPTLVRLLIPVLMASWLGTGLLYGFDPAQWLWTGLSLVAAVLATLFSTCRRRRTAAPSGVDGPRHRGAVADEEPRRLNVP